MEMSTIFWFDKKTEFEIQFADFKRISSRKNIFDVVSIFDKSSNMQIILKDFLSDATHIMI